MKIAGRERHIGIECRGLWRRYRAAQWQVRVIQAAVRRWQPEALVVVDDEVTGDLGRPPLLGLIVLLRTGPPERWHGSLHTAASERD